jgi:hypothetical protein
MSEQEIAKKGDQEILFELQALFDTLQVLLVIDDIDTLTTAGIDPGMDALFRLISRAKSGGKILYTLRNAPTHSLQSAIEVPKLTRNVELPELLSVCCRQFKVPDPIESEIGTIAHKSECRPLAVEVIVGLRRKCDNYDRSLRLFEGKEGDEARRYLFEREWNALPKDNRARYLLVALSVFGRKVKFEELQAALQYSEDHIKDCIAQTIEMFLVAHQDNEATEYSVGQATLDFLKLVGPQLEYYEKVRYGVKYYISSHLAEDPLVSKGIFELERLMRRGDLDSAAEIILAPSLPAKVSQHPQFNMIAGLVFAKQDPPKYDLARAHFRRGAQGRLRDIEAMRQWYWMERNSHFNMLTALEVCDLVASGKQYNPRDRSEFLAKKGHILNFRGRQSWFEDQERSLQHYNDALTCYMESLIVIGGQDETEHDKLEGKYVMTIRDVLEKAEASLFADRPDLSDKALDILFNKAIRKRSLFDHWCEPIMEMSASITRRLTVRRDQRIAPRAAGLLQKTLSAFEGRDPVKVDDQALLDRLRRGVRVQIMDLQKVGVRA